MASTGGVDQFSVGQISQVLSKSRKRKKEQTDNSGLQSLFSLSSPIQPVFVPVKVKKKKVQVTDDKEAEEKPSSKKTKTDSITKTGHNNDYDDLSSQVKSKKCQDAPERLERTIFVGNIPVALNKKVFKKHFEKYGVVESVRFRSAALAKPKMSRAVGMKKKEFHKDRQCLNGYVVFKNRNAAEDALQSNGDEIEGMHIRVDLAGDNKVHDHSRSVFVGNLPFDTEEDPLREVFKDCGEIEAVRLIRDGKTRIGKGFGYILFKDKDAVGFSLKLNQIKFKGRPIRILPSSEHPRKGQNLKVKRGKPPPHLFSGAQAKKNHKFNKPKHAKRKEKSGTSSGLSDKRASTKKKHKGAPTKRSSAFKQALNVKTKSK